MLLTQTYSAVDGYATSEGTKKYVDNAIDNNEILRSHYHDQSIISSYASNLIYTTIFPISTHSGRHLFASQEQ